jgi:hypothetical protein
VGREPSFGIAAKQKDEALQVVTKLLDTVSRVADELGKGRRPPSKWLAEDSTPSRRTHDHTLRWRKRINSPGPQPGDCRFEPGTEHCHSPRKGSRAGSAQPGNARRGRDLSADATPAAWVKAPSSNG